MSFVNDISGSTGARHLPGQGSTPRTATQPAPTAADRLTQRFGHVFQRTFSSSLATVFERGAAGEFDDPGLRLQEQAALERLRVASQAARSGPRGANGAPRADGAATPARARAAASDAARAEQREVFALRARQSEARLRNISVTLTRDFPKAARLASASTGAYDPATFVPRDRGEVEAFAQRMVIDAVESAARLEIVQTQLDAARFELAGGGGPELRQQVAELEATYARQRAYVDKLARIVDTQSGGQVEDAGVGALSGASLRDAGDLPVAELVAALRASGMDDAQVRRIVGAAELAVEQERQPEGSARLKAISQAMTTHLLLEFDRMRQLHRQEFRRQEEQRADERRQETRQAEQRTVERVRSEQARDAREQQRRAAFELWLQSLAAAREHERPRAS